MGNRAVITTLSNYNNNGIGVYLHWNGGRDSVEGFLEYMKLKQHRTPDEDCYGWARLCQVIGNFFGGTTSLGIDTVDNLDTDNGDNGVYIISGWDIVGRKDFNGVEQRRYELEDMLRAIDEKQPAEEQLGREFFDAIPTPTDKLLVGDDVYVPGYDGKYDIYTVIGFGNEELVNGHNVNGVPFTDKYTYPDGNDSRNYCNYLLDKTYRVIKHRVCT